MDVSPSFVTHRQPPKASQPGQRAFDDPAIPPQLLATLDPFAGNAHLDVPLGQCPSTTRNVIRFVGV